MDLKDFVLSRKTTMVKNPGKRLDGSEKDIGFLGPLKRKDGRMSSELSAGFEIDGKEVELPLIVPTLTKEELKFLLDDFVPGSQIPQSIINKAVNHALSRIDSGKSPFFNRSEK